MTDFEQLDTDILLAINNGAVKFYLIEAAVSRTLDVMYGTRRTNAFRAVDRRLQALSKRGLIQYWRGKWRIVERASGQHGEQWAARRGRTRWL